MLPVITMGVHVGVGVGVAVDVAVAVGVDVGVALGVGVGVNVAVTVGVDDGVSVEVAVAVGVGVGVTLDVPLIRNTWSGPLAAGKQTLFTLQLWQKPEPPPGFCQAAGKFDWTVRSLQPHFTCVANLMLGSISIQ